MPSFSVEFGKLLARRAKEIGRNLSKDESSALEGELFHAWIDSGRQDELIRTIHTNFGRDGGLEEIIVLGHHLRETRDVARVHALFGGLLSRRVKAFYGWWPKAQAGHAGCMQSAARAMAEAMDAYIEYFISLEKLGLLEEMEALREEMKLFQARAPIATVLPKARGSAGQEGS